MPPTDMPNGQTELELAQTAAEYVLRQTSLRPRIALVLGSGLASFAEELTGSIHIPYTTVPHFPHTTATGHPGLLTIGESADIPLAVMQGRIHLYEGYSAQQVAFPVRAFAAMGVRAAILTNAAGAINLDYRPGDLVIVRDHINLQGHNPLTGHVEERSGPRFVDMSGAYAKPYREIAQHAAGRMKQILREGVYAAVLGPSYETPAEIQFLRTIGADLVGMSTVLEVIAARQLGIDVLAISCVTNMAAGLNAQPLTHTNVLETAECVRNDLAALLRIVIPRIAATLKETA